ncbi:MAG: polysaccharide pyruvyl transferase CsaB [Peptococcaceae bacterium]|jgi:polysaccharide pyruvyl transferase CsaB|nr:polysaccharide pyruvyl transferase CsaB [Peptococcaceae bacterium]
MNPKIVMSGYYGFQNAGDDAVCYAIIEALRHEVPGCDITVLSNDPALTTKTYGVAAADRWKIKDIWKALGQADLLVSGGGSLLQDVTSKNSPIYYLGIIFMAMLRRKPVVIYGQGLGPLNSKRNRTLVKWAFNHVRAIHVRDDESYELVRELGVKDPVQVAPDPVLGIDGDVVDSEKGRHILEGLGYDSARPLALIALRDWANTNYVHEFAALGDALVEQGYSVGLLAMHHDQDETISKAVCAHMRGGAFVIADAYDTPTLFSIFDNAALVVGMRLHALIIGAALDKDVMAISYDPKVASFMKMIHNPHCVGLDEVTAARLIETADACLHTDLHEAEHRMHALKRLSRTPATHCAEILTNK